MPVLRRLSPAPSTISTSLFKLFAAAAALLITTELLPAPLSAQIQFTATPYASVSGNNGSSSIVNGDFNNDGILDIVTINSNTISFYGGLGSGNFAEPVNQTAAANLGQAFAADLNGDGKLDLAVVGNGVTILLGNGDGTFTPGTNIDINNGAPFFITLADFNGDHVPDVAASICNDDSCSVQVFLGKGDGTFNLSATLSLGGGQVVAGDFNADGHQDIAVIVGDGLSGTAVYLGNGNGTFQTPLQANTVLAPISLAVGDFYNDRIQTLVVMNTDPHDGNFKYWVNTIQYSKGALVATNPELASSQQYYANIIAGDLQGNFQSDIVMVGGQTYPGPLTTFLRSSGNGQFNDTTEEPAYGYYETFPFIRDLNLDSRQDIGTAWNASELGNGGGAYILLNDNAVVNCDPPPANKLSANICAPKSGQTVNSTFTFRGSGDAFNGIAKRMELWIDGKKIGQNLEDQLKVTTTLSTGKHTASFVVVDSFDNYTSNSVTFTAK
jgi:hypothetical protein